MQLPGGQWLWGGDLWQSGNRVDGFKSHDGLVWVPLAFTSDGKDMLPISFNRTWQFTI